MNVFNPYCLTLIFIFSVGAKASVLEYPETEDDMARAMLALDYEDVPKNYSFQNANQSYDLPEGWAIFHKENARKLLFYINGADTFSKVNADLPRKSGLFQATTHSRPACRDVIPSPNS